MLKNLALGMILGNDRAMLEKCVVKYDGLFPEKYIVPNNNIDGGKEFLNDRNWLSTFDKPVMHYGDLRNRLLQVSTQMGKAPWLLMLDADEVMFLSDLIALDTLVETVVEPVIRLPRYNLAGPKFDWFDQGYPDWQARVIKLDTGVTFSGQVHEQAVVGHAFAPGHFATQHIYHYGYCRDPRLIWLRHQNYDRLAAGLAPLDESAIVYPDDIESYISRHNLKPFNQPHPLAT